VNRDQRSYL